jgi:hypothetical protein
VCVNKERLGKPPFIKSVEVVVVNGLIKRGLANLLYKSVEVVVSLNGLIKRGLANLFYKKC